MPLLVYNFEICDRKEQKWQSSQKTCVACKTETTERLETSWLTKGAHYKALRAYTGDLPLFKRICTGVTTNVIY